MKWADFPFGMRLMLVGLVLLLFVNGLLFIAYTLGNPWKIDPGTATLLGSIVGLAIVGWQARAGIDKWRSETRGKRRADLAVKVLSNVYQMAEILRAAREPWVLPQEMTAKEGVPNAISQDANYAPEGRLLEHQEFFGQFRALKNEFVAEFGRSAAKPFDELWRVRVDVNHAVDFMLRNKEFGQSRDPEDRRLWQETYRTAFRHVKEEHDEIAKRIEAQVAAVEAICRPAIDLVA